MIARVLIALAAFVLGQIIGGNVHIMGPPNVAAQGGISQINAGSGIIVANPNGPTSTISYNTAVIPSIASAQAGTPWFCNSTNGTTNYTCSLGAASALTVYTKGMWLMLTVDATNTSVQPTLQVDLLPQVSLMASNGTSIPVAGSIAAGVPHIVFYDGTVWRLML